MPRPLYCPDPPTGRHARHFNTPDAKHRPRIRDLAIDYAVRYGRLDRTTLMEACAEPERFLALYDATDDPTVHRAIYCVELGNRPQHRLAIEDAINDLLHSAQVLPHPGEGCVWYAHMLNGQESGRIAYWEACTPERLKELPAAPTELVHEPGDLLLWRDKYQDDKGHIRIVGWDVVCDNRSEADLMLSTLDIYLHGGPQTLPLHEAVMELQPTSADLRRR